MSNKKNFAGGALIGAGAAGLAALGNAAAKGIKNRKARLDENDGGDKNNVSKNTNDENKRREKLMFLRMYGILKELCLIDSLNPCEKLGKAAEEKALCEAYGKKLAEVVSKTVKFVGVGHYVSSAEEALKFSKELKEAKDELRKLSLDEVSVTKNEDSFDYGKFLIEQIKFAYSGIGNEKELADIRQAVYAKCKKYEHTYRGAEIKTEYNRVAELVKDFLEKEDSAEECFEFGVRLLGLFEDEKSNYSFVFYEDAEGVGKLHYKMASVEEVVYPAVKERGINRIVMEGKAR